jgi:hypothetical protein
MFNFFGRHVDEAEDGAETIKDVDLVLGVEAKYLTLTGGGVRLRISKEDAGLLTDREALARKFHEKEAPVDKRIWDDESEVRFIKISRLFKHGLEMNQISAVLGESESDNRSFWGWAVDLNLSREPKVASALAAALAADDLPLIPARFHPSALFGPEPRITKVSLRGPRVAELLRAGGVHDAAKTLGVHDADLERWLSDPINGRMIEVLSK